MQYSVITRTGSEGTYFIVPLEQEDTFVDIDCDRPEYSFAQLDDMLQVMNEYASGPAHDHRFETEHYRFSRDQADIRPGMLAQAVLKK